MSWTITNDIRAVYCTAIILNYLCLCGYCSADIFYVYDIRYHQTPTKPPNINEEVYKIEATAVNKSCKSETILYSR